MGTNGKEFDQAIARSYVYDLVSAGFLYPDENLRRMVSTGDFQRQLEWASRVLGIPAPSFSESDLEPEYLLTFGHTISKECPLYETEYGCEHVFAQTQRLADIAGFYRAFGLEVSEGGERLDHLGTELEFLSFLACKEAYARLQGDQEKADVCRDAERKFLAEHVQTWVPLFVELLKKKSPPGFYRSLASFLEQFLHSQACPSVGETP